MTRSLAHLVLLSILQSTFIQTTGAVTCFGVNGLAYSNNIICPGSNACCGSTATCLPNRLCHNQGQNNSTFVRGPCAITPYTTASCAEICVYNETATDNGFLPRVTTCADGSLCCDNDPNCCEAGQGVFLDSTGEIVSSTSSSTTQLSSSTTASSSFASSAGPSYTSAMTTSGTVSPSQSASNTSGGSSPSFSSSSGLSKAAKVGLGVGIPLGVAALGGFVIIIWLQQRQIKRVGADIATVSEVNQGTVRTPTTDSESQFRDYPKEMDSSIPSLPVELSAGIVVQLLYRERVGYALAQTYAVSKVPALLTADEDLKSYLSEDGHDYMTSYTHAGKQLTVESGINMACVDMGPGSSSTMHRTLSIDFVVVTEGDVELELDSGEKRILYSGDMVVQRATMQGWTNLSQEKPARFIGITISSDRIEVRGKKIEQVFLPI